MSSFVSRDYWTHDSDGNKSIYSYAYSLFLLFIQIDSFI